MAQSRSLDLIHASLSLPGKAHERSAPTLGRAAAKEGAGQDMPDALGPAASQTLDPPAGNPNAQGLAHRNRAALAQCMRGADPCGWFTLIRAALQRLTVGLSGPGKLAPSPGARKLTFTLTILCKTPKNLLGCKLFSSLDKRPQTY